jgi:hypothetical protein
LLIAWKYEHEGGISLDELTKTYSKRTTPAAIKQAEGHLLNLLDFRISFPTIVTFLDLYYEDGIEEVITTRMMIANIVTYDHEHYTYLHSELANAILIVTDILFGAEFHRDDHDEHELQCIKDVRDALYRAMGSMRYEVSDVEGQGGSGILSEYFIVEHKLDNLRPLYNKLKVSQTLKRIK